MQKANARTYFIRLVMSPSARTDLTYAASAANADLSDTAEKFTSRLERRCKNEQKQKRFLAAETRDQTDN